MKKDSREKIENNILKTSDSIREILDIENWEWLSSSVIDQFIKHFEELMIYYRDTGDPTISRRVLLEYVIWTRYFNTIVTDAFEPSTGEEIPTDAKSIAQHHIDILKTMMDRIVEYEGW